MPSPVLIQAFNAVGSANDTVDVSSGTAVETRKQCIWSALLMRTTDEGCSHAYLPAFPCETAC